LSVLQPLLKALPQRLTGPGVPRQLERGFLGEDGAGRLVLVRLDAALEANPGDWHLMLGSGQDWDMLGRGNNHSINPWNLQLIIFSLKNPSKFVKILTKLGFRRWCSGYA